MLFLAGFAALGVNRPEEAIRLLRRIRPGRSADVWDDFGTRLPFALHLTGRFEEELRDAANRRGRKRLLLGAIGDEARALAALGRLAAVDRLMLEVATLPADGPRTPGHVMFDAAQELRAHGHEQEATALFRRAATWARTQTTTESAGSHTAALLARALQQSGDYATADSIHRARLSVGRHEFVFTNDSCCLEERFDVVVTPGAEPLRIARALRYRPARLLVRTIGVESAQVNQGMPGRIFNYGRLVISGAGAPQAPIPGISDPMATRRAFMEFQDQGKAA